MNEKEMIKVEQKAVRRNEDNTGVMADLLNQELSELQKAMIEEMAHCNFCYHQFGKCTVKNRKDCSDWQLAKYNYEKGYRIINKDSVVLSKEEYEELKKQVNELEEQRDRQAYIAEDLIQEKHRWTEQARKETAKEIIALILERYGYLGILEDIAKQYGV